MTVSKEYLAYFRSFCHTPHSQKEKRERGKELMDTDNSTVIAVGGVCGGGRGYRGINDDGKKSDFVTLKNETLHDSIY